MMPFKKNLTAAGSGFSDYYVPEEKFLGPPSPKNLATPLNLNRAFKADTVPFKGPEPLPRTLLSELQRKKDNKKCAALHIAGHH